MTSVTPWDLVGLPPLSACCGKAVVLNDGDTVKGVLGCVVLGCVVVGCVVVGCVVVGCVVVGCVVVGCVAAK